MAISTYSELKTAIAAWLNRSDLTSDIPTFILLAEKFLSKQITNRQMEDTTNLSLTAGDPTVALPADFISARTVTVSVNGIPHVLQYLPLQTLNKMYAASDTGTPDYYAITGTDMKVAKVPDADYTAELVYQQEIPALSDLNTTNWLLTDHPDIYLFAALIQAGVFITDEKMIATYTQILTVLLSALTGQNQRAAVDASGTGAVLDFYTP